MIDLTGLNHELYIRVTAPDLAVQLDRFRDREFGDITGKYLGDFDFGKGKIAQYSVEWNEGVRYAYSGTEDECIAYIEGYMDGYHEGRR